MVFLPFGGGGDIRGGRGAYARLVVPDHSHHVTQRGNCRAICFGDDDYRSHLALLAEWCRKAGTEVWAYCPMPDHVHLVLVPSHVDGLRAALEAIQGHARGGRPLGSDGFLETLASITGRSVKPRSPGRPKHPPADA